MKSKKTDDDQDESGSSCPFMAGWDQSDAACRNRTDALYATIPCEVAAQVRELAVAEFGLCIAKFVARTVKPKTKMLLDEAVFRLANGSPLGIYCAFIEFTDGAKVRFEGMKFKDFTPGPGEKPA